MIKNLVMENRSYRRFFQDEKISMDTLKELVNLGRLSPSGKNVQPLRYLLINDEEENERVFPHLKWAGYLKDWDGPIEGEKPSAYIIIMWEKALPTPRDIALCDLGLATQSILLGAREKGLGGCIFWSFSRKDIEENFNIDDKYEILQVIAIGKPKEKVVIDEIDKNDDIQYWRDENSVHHVPKRKLGDIIIK